MTTTAKFHLMKNGKFLCMPKPPAATIKAATLDTKVVDVCRRCIVAARAASGRKPFAFNIREFVTPVVRCDECRITFKDVPGHTAEEQLKIHSYRHRSENVSLAAIKGAFQALTNKPFPQDEPFHEVGENLIRNYGPAAFWQAVDRYRETHCAKCGSDDLVDMNGSGLVACGGCGCIIGTTK